MYTNINLTVSALQTYKKSLAAVYHLEYSFLSEKGSTIQSFIE